MQHPNKSPPLGSARRENETVIHQTKFITNGNNSEQVCETM